MRFGNYVSNLFQNSPSLRAVLLSLLIPGLALTMAAGAEARHHKSPSYVYVNMSHFDKDELKAVNEYLQQKQSKTIMDTPMEIPSIRRGLGQEASRQHPYGPIVSNITTTTVTSRTTITGSGIDAFINKYNKRIDANNCRALSRAFESTGQQYNIDPKLLASLVAVESSFNPSAISSSGAIGLGQLKPATAKWLGVNDPYDPEQNLQGVGRYLRFLLNKYNGSVDHALAAYYQGQGTIDRRGINDDARYYIGKITKVFHQIASR